MLSRLLRRVRGHKIAVPMVITGLLFASCGGGGEPTASPVPMATSAPTLPPAATPTSARAPAPTATPRPAPTATPQQAATAANVPQGTLRVALDTLGTFGFIDVPIATSRFYLEPIFDYMIGPNDDGSLNPSLSVLTSWQANADVTQYTYKLRKGVRFHDGQEVTAKDMKFTLEWGARPGNTQTGAADLRAIMDSVETPDDQTVVVKLKGRDILFAANFTSPMGLPPNQGFIYPGHLVKDVGDFNRSPIGSGPYKVKDIRAGDRMTFEVAGNHWLYGIPRYAAMEFRAVPEEGTKRALLQSGSVDIVTISRGGAQPLRQSGFGVLEKPAGSVANVHIHQQHHPGNPLGDLRVRKALALAINRQAVLLFLSGFGKLTNSHPITALSSAYYEVPIPPFDPDQAKRLLAEAGHSALQLNVFIYPWPGLPESPEMMEAIATMWEAIGVKVERRPLDFASFRTSWFAQKLPNPSVAGIQALPERLIPTAFSSPQSASRLHEDPVYFDIAAKASGAANQQEYDKYLREAQARKAEQHHYITLLRYGDLYAAAPGIQWNLGVVSFSMNINRLLKR